MKQLYPDLWQTQAEHPFGPGSATHAYLLTRSSGNLLFYSCGHAGEYPEISRLGGAVRQYLSHRDEAGPALRRIKESLGSLLCCHALEAEAVRKFCPVDLTFEHRECHLGDIEVIPTPGHTDGSTCFLCTSRDGKLRYLFTGDTLFPDGDSWGTYVSPSHRRTLAESLESLRALEPDVVLSSASSGRPFQEMGPGEWQAIVDRAINSLSD
jgi:glyoxylase-like metal-dependent hydrolase (beta-lactamase superfamily II)